MNDSVVYIRSDHSKVHLGTRRGTTLYTAEACNVDALAHREELDSIEDVPGDDLCSRCFPRADIQGYREPTTTP